MNMPAKVIYLSWDEPRKVKALKNLFRIGHCKLGGCSKDGSYECYFEEEDYDDALTLFKAFEESMIEEGYEL